MTIGDDGEMEAHKGEGSVVRGPGPQGTPGEYLLWGFLHLGPRSGQAILRWGICKRTFLGTFLPPRVGPS